MNIYGKKVTLRALEMRDMPRLAKWHNDPETANFLLGWSFPISRYEQIEWYKKSVKDPQTRRFAIDDEKGNFIGIIGLWNINWKDREASVGILLGEKNCRGKGYGTDAMKTLMDYAFNELQMHRLSGEILAYNEASKKFTGNLGWQQEGIARKKVFRSGKYHDVVMVAVLEEDYFKRFG